MPPGRGRKERTCAAGQITLAASRLRGQDSEVDGWILHVGQLEDGGRHFRVAGRAVGLQLASNSDHKLGSGPTAVSEERSRLILKSVSGG